jgi:hypothetical protein
VPFEQTGLKSVWFWMLAIKPEGMVFIPGVIFPKKLLSFLLLYLLKLAS